MSLLTREQLLNQDDRKTIEVKPPGWDGAVRLRTISAAEREAWEQRAREEIERGQFYADFLIMCAVDENDRPLLTKDDAEMITRKSARALKFLFDEAQKLNGMGTAAEEEAKKS
jgi:superfamily I DNA/RNA helicase